MDLATEIVRTAILYVIFSASFLFVNITARLSNEEQIDLIT